MVFLKHLADQEILVVESKDLSLYSQKLAMGHHPGSLQYSS
jgi:hypothetical protein